MSIQKDDPLTIRAIKIALGDNDNGALEWANSYGEPGYTDPEKCILFANWNDVEREFMRRWQLRQMRTEVPNVAPGKYHEEQCANRARRAWRALEQRLESQGYKLEWCDEWTIDYDSNAKAYRTEPDSHGWEPRVRACDGFYLFPDSDADDWIEDSLNEDGRPLPSWFDDSELERHGFVRWDQDDKQVGFHPGQNDTPDKFVPALQKEGYDFILKLTGRGQFDVHYEVWTRKECDEDTEDAVFCEYKDTYYVHKQG